MDLRGFAMPPRIAETIQDLMAGGVTWYQPFIFRDDLIAGVAAMWNAGGDKYLYTASDPEETRRSALHEALRLTQWYAHVAELMVAAFPTARSVLDFGCNLGHFGFDLVPRGMDYCGIDMPRNEPGVRLLQELAGLQFEFAGSPYDEDHHRLAAFEGSREFDVGILSVVLMHLTDPHYAMPYLAAKFRQGFFFSTALLPGTGLDFKARMTHYNRGKPPPHAFELVPTVPLAEVLMQLCGFGFLYRIPYRVGVDPGNVGRTACWIASRAALPDDVVDRFQLSAVPDRIETFTEAAPRGWSSDRFRNQEHRRGRPDG